MHCANLDALVSDMRSMHLSSSPPATIPDVVVPESMAESPPSPSNEEAEISKMVLDIGMFVLEGRLPHRKTKRGYIQGPHCVLQPPQAQPHRCDYSNYMCERARKYSRLMEAIWNENKTLCIELRICADCLCGEEQVWKNSVSRYDYVLEQWIFDVTNFRNNGDGIGIMNGYGLLQAIRSQIHFSQLSAWWSSNQAQLPKNITYHVIPLTQVDLNSVPLQHTFPVLAFNSTYLQVKVRSQPRSEVLPKIHCPIHCNQDDVVDDRMKIYCDRLGKHHCQALLEELDENENGTLCDDGFVEAEALDGLIDEDAKRIAIERATKYGCCAVADDAPKHGLNECALGDRHFSTFHKNSRYFAHSNPKQHVSHSSSFLDASSCSSVDPIECRKPKIDPTLFSYCRLKESSGGSAFAKTNCNCPSELEAKQPRMARNSSTSTAAAAARFTIDAEATPLRKADKRAVETLYAKTTDFQSRPRLNVEAGVNGGGGRAEDCEGGWLADVNSVLKSNKSLTKLVTSIGGAGGRDRFAEVGLHCPRRGAAIHTDDNNNNSSVVEVRKICGEGARRSSKLSTTKTIVSPTKSPKSADKLRATVIRRYFRDRDVAAKPLLPLFGNVIESVLSGRMYFSRVVENFKVKITGCVPFGSHSVGTELPAAAYYYHFGDVDLSRSYLVKSSIPDREKGIQISSTGQLQVSVFNTENSLIKVFIVPYDLSDMPRCTKTYVRHSNYYAPADITQYSIQWLQSLIQFKCVCSKSGRLYLQSEINIIMFQKADLNTACELQQRSELKHHNVTEIAYK